MFKFVPFFAVLAVARAGILQAAAPLAIAQPVLTKSVDEYDPHPQYNFGYEVQDALSGDSKNQVESRDGDVVQGQYSLTDADGYRRIVDYSADPINGFNAVVRREPLGVKAIAAAPALVKSAPLALAAPIAPLASYTAGPALIKSAPLATTYAAAAPALLRSASIAPSYAATSYAAPGAYASYAAPGAYASYAAPAAYTSYAAPSLIKSAPLATYAAAPAAYSVGAAPAAYSVAAPSFIKSAPIASYAAPLAAGSIVKTSYSSPIASYHY